MTGAAESCFHCGEPFAMPGVATARAIVVNGERQLVCCAGCEAAALLISAAGLADYYRWRTSPAPRPEDGGSADRWAAFDRPEVLAAQATAPGGGFIVQLMIEGTRCAACSWLIEHRLAQISGVSNYHLNPVTSRAQLTFDPATVALSAILRSIVELGYTPHLLGEADTLEVATRERRTALKRLAVAGFGMMQVMMIAVGLYAGSFHGIEPVVRSYLRIVSLIVTTPVTLYAAWPLFSGAIRALLARRMSMDLPVVVGIVSAYLVSCWNTFTDSGEVYFDSVTMFVFLLQLGRYLEMIARHHAGSTTEALARLLPGTALRVGADGIEESVPLAALALGDLVRVAAGSAFPADGRLVGGGGEVDESLLTGESAAVVKQAGDTIIAGSVNLAAPALVTVTGLGASTVLASIVRLLDRAQTQRPRMAHTADRVGAWFLRGVLVIALLVAVFWLWIDPSRAFEATFAVLVVACPCALSLATPVALAAATSRLARHGLLVTRADALEALATADRVVFDKTGTLTAGQPSVTAIQTTGPEGPQGCMRLAAALERGTGHPIARAFGDGTAYATELMTVPGAGVEGIVDGIRLRIGHAAFVAALAGDRPATLAEDGVHLGRAGAWIARFELTDALRGDARRAVGALGALGLEPEIVSGDHANAVAGVAHALGIRRFAARATPADKLARIESLRNSGARVMMVGDGVNDAPCMKAAYVSVAIGSGSALAQVSADIVMVRNHLPSLGFAIQTARRTLKVVRQNLAWAALYNIVSLPIAALGLIPPWIAAVGMSTSSLIVVLNALRLMKAPRPQRPAAATVPPHEAVTA